MSEAGSPDGKGVLGKLRRRAEALMSVSPDDLASMEFEDIQGLVYELQVHQVELELQNEELRATQLQLEASRDSFRALYELAPVGYISLDRSGRIARANLTAGTLLGRERSRLVGTRFTDFVAPHAQEAFFLYWQSLLSGSGTESCNLQIIGATAETRHIRLESTSFDSGEQPGEHVHIALIDIAHTLQAEARLVRMNQSLEETVSKRKKELELLANVAADMGEGVLITTGHKNWPESRIIFANNAMQSISGYSPDELLGAQPAMLLAAEALRDVLMQLGRELLINNIFRGELRYRHREGEYRDIEIFISPMLDTEQHVNNYVCIQRDITVRKRIESDLAEREHRLRALLNTSQDAIITIDRAGIVQDCNLAVQSLFGYLPPELIGRNVSLLMPSPYREEHDGYLLRYLETGRAHIIGSGRELSAQHRDGHTFPVFLTVNEVDHLGLYVGFIKDISEVRGLQRRILQAAVEERIRIGQALHDGPQNALSGLSLQARGLALDLAGISPEHEAQAAQLAQALNRASREVRQLAQGLVPVHTEADGLMAALERLADRTAQDTGLACRFVCPEPIRLDDAYVADQLYFIAQEAVRNAATHARARAIEIRLEKEGSHLALSVVDDGRGISPEAREGGGLGLSIMPFRATTVGGRLTVSAAEGGGTEVCCALSTTLSS